MLRDGRKGQVEVEEVEGIDKRRVGSNLMVKA